MTGVLRKIPSMKNSELMQLWKNAVKYKHDRSNAKRKEDANKILNAIDQEWKKRRKKPISELFDDYFDWPSTKANKGKGSIDASAWRPDGLLDYMGYNVGEAKGVRTETRRAILRQIFEGELPPVFSPAYLSEWGTRGSTGRLMKMAETLAAFTRNAKRRKGMNMRRSIEEWESDLEFLYEEYYINKFNFAWPDT